MLCDEVACFSFRGMSKWTRLHCSHLWGLLTAVILKFSRLPSWASEASLRTIFWPRFWMAWPLLALSRREVRLTAPVISLTRYCTGMHHFRMNFGTLWCSCMMRLSLCQCDLTIKCVSILLTDSLEERTVKYFVVLLEPHPSRYVLKQQSGYQHFGMSQSVPMPLPA